MKCLYYLSPTLGSTRTISDDLHAVGVKDWYIHVISNDEAGLKKERIHSSNYIESYDFVRTGLVGAYIGFFVGMFGAFLVLVTQVFGSNVSVLAYFAIMLVATFFGAWLGVMLGLGSENKKLHQFHDEIQNGQYLFLIYAREREREIIKAMMREKHPESNHVATDEHFISPFSDVSRKNPSAS